MALIRGRLRGELPSSVAPALDCLDGIEPLSHTKLGYPGVGVCSALRPQSALKPRLRYALLKDQPRQNRQTSEPANYKIVRHVIVNCFRSGDFVFLMKMIMSIECLRSMEKRNAATPLSPRHTKRVYLNGRAMTFPVIDRSSILLARSTTSFAHRPGNAKPTQLTHARDR